MIVWGGDGVDSCLNTGGRYNPQHGQLDSHQHHQRARCAESDHTAVWTGSEMIVWGGYNGYQLFEHRRQIQSRHGQLDSHQHHQCAHCPSCHTAVWTGSEMIVWGGV